MTETPVTTEAIETSEDANPWKKVFVALALGAAAGGATYALTRKVRVSKDDTEESETES